MKKRLILKIVLNTLLIASITLAVIEGIDASKSIHIFGDGSKMVEGYFIKRTISFFLSAFMQLIFLIFLDFKGITYLSESIIKSIRKNKESYAADRKQKRIESLEKELEELKKDE